MTKEINIEPNEDSKPTTDQVDEREVVPVVESGANVEADDPHVTIINPGIRSRQIKKDKGINWVFPLLTCAHGNKPTHTQCECAINAPEFMGDDCCYSNPTEENPTPQLCSSFTLAEQD